MMLVLIGSEESGDFSVLGHISEKDGILAGIMANKVGKQTQIVQ